MELSSRNFNFFNRSSFGNAFRNISWKVKNYYWRSVSAAVLSDADLLRYCLFAFLCSVLEVPLLLIQQYCFLNKTSKREDILSGWRRVGLKGNSPGLKDSRTPPVCYWFRFPPYPFPKQIRLTGCKIRPRTEAGRYSVLGRGSRGMRRVFLVFFDIGRI